MSIKCKVESVKPLTNNTYQLLLIPEQAINYQAGQYLQVIMGEKDKRPFSIASSPCRQQGSELELHIGSADHNPYTYEVVEKAQACQDQGDYSFEIDAPCGEAWFDTANQRPLILIAGGTGFSYVRSILDHCLSQNYAQPIYIYWGARELAHLYANEELQALSLQKANLTYVPVVENADENWQGKRGNVLQAVLADFSSLADFDIYLAGRFEMSAAARELFCQQRDAKVEQLHSDAFAFI